MLNKVYFDLFGLLIKFSFYDNKCSKLLLLSYLDFYYIFYIILKFNDYFIIKSYYFNLFNIILKDYRFFIYGEFILNFNFFLFFSFKFFNKISLENF